MNRNKYTELIKILIISIIKIEKEITDFIIYCNKSNNLINIIAERKNETLPLMQIIDLLELNNNECEEFIYKIYDIINDTSDIEYKVERLLKKYEKRISFN